MTQIYFADLHFANSPIKKLYKETRAAQATLNEACQQPIITFRVNTSLETKGADSDCFSSPYSGTIRQIEIWN